jgi:Zn-dependent protease with chaperone function
MQVPGRLRYRFGQITFMSRRHDVTMWVMTAYLSVVSLVFAFVAWTLWIWRDGLLTPEETTAIMIKPILIMGPFAVLLDVLFAFLLARFLRRRAKGH